MISIYLGRVVSGQCRFYGRLSNGHLYSHRLFHPLLVDKEREGGEGGGERGGGEGGERGVTGRIERRLAELVGKKVSIATYLYIYPSINLFIYLSTNI